MTGLAGCGTCVRENSSLSPHLPNRSFLPQAASAVGETDLGQNAIGVIHLPQRLDNRAKRHMH
jgi:hypothetical protein